MVFENLTLFELNVEDAQFGPHTMGESEEDVETHEGTATTGGRRRYVWFGLGIATIAAAVAVRRYRGREGDADIEIETAEAEDAATVEN